MNFAFIRHDHVESWLAKNAPRTSLQYGFGCALPPANCATLIAIRRAYNAGRIELVQRREATGFAYIAQMRHKPVLREDHELFSPLQLDVTRKAF